MPAFSFTPLRCTAATLDRLQSDFAAFAPADAGADWIVTGLFLRCGDDLFYASTDIDVRPDGLVARPLAVAPVTTMLADIDDALPDIRARAAARGYAGPIPDAPVELADIPGMKAWGSEPTTLHVVLCSAETATTRHRIACGLLFAAADGTRLLVASDPQTPALVASMDDELVDLYVAACDLVDPDSYRAMLG